MDRETILHFHKLRKDFYNITGVTIPFNIVGMDIVKLDSMLKVPENQSMADFLLKNYGQEAHDIIDELCGITLI